MNIKFFSILSVSLCLCGSLRAQTPIRLSADSAIRSAQIVTDSNTLQSIQFIRGDYVTFEVGLFSQGIFLYTNAQKFSTITLAVFQNQSDTNAPMMLQVVTNIAPGAGTNSWVNTNCTLANWTNGPTGSTNQTVVFAFTDSQTSIPLNSQASQSYWLRVYATTTNTVAENVTFLETSITVWDGPIASGGYTSPNWGSYIIVDIFGNIISPTNFWTQNLPSYVLTNGMSGTINLGPNTTPINLNIGDIASPNAAVVIYGTLSGVQGLFGAGVTNSSSTLWMYSSGPIVGSAGFTNLSGTQPISSPFIISANGMSSATNYFLTGLTLTAWANTNKFDCLASFSVGVTNLYRTNSAGTAIAGTVSGLETNAAACQFLIPAGWGFTNKSVGSIAITAK